MESENVVIHLEESYSEENKIARLKLKRQRKEKEEEKKVRLV